MSTEQVNAMNILYTEASLGISGQELQALSQIEALIQAGHQVILACRKNSRIACEAASLGIRATYVPFTNSLHIPSVITLRRLIVAFRPDIVICHSDLDSNITALTRAFLRGPDRYFCIIRQKTYLPQKIEMFPLNHMCDVVVVPTTEMQSRLIHEKCIQPVVVVPPGIDFSVLRRQAEMALPVHVEAWLNNRPPAPVIVQVAMICPDKGHHFLLNVLHSLRQKGLRFYWLIAGSGCRKDEERLQAEIKYLDMEDCVLMCGPLLPVAPVYRIASLLVMPSRNETFGRVIMEAAACGVPVMASRVGGIPVVMQNGRNGTLLPPEDKIAWMSALEKFFLTPEYAQELTLRAGDDIESRYSIDSTVRELMNLGKRCQYIQWGRGERITPNNTDCN
ncbi:glycosyltransferase family 4 protein [Escherichia coli]|uniref:glycosyltransferase family 4 protein n=2 Tax=Escherichia coli TaxID=562 RepID=UPI000B7F0F61|nr:glycosyltransferase family 4 protein [Escherichia coli]EEZ9256898.1 glycosyltransferase family 4 protein [Escherichia coli]EFM2190674.1 glycosyltransferase family 4 protein [Escherichia coli]EFP2198568.1 glycosyltransferase family 4 protein [Escherichia coli]EKK4597930.1 glycosyltransferase family 4 protein [Escherichia coli]ELR8653748.1 glycosyltransferase family 4 protein [Escherichia coli]